MRIPVFHGEYLIDIVDQQRADRIAQAPNAVAKKSRARKGKPARITSIHLQDFGADKPLDHPKANPRRYSHDHENEQNAQGCWTLRRLDASTADIYRTAVLDCLKKEAA